jgi:ketosteroid isomerase-like protein
MDKVESSPAIEAFRSYARAFQSLDPKAVATHFHEPALMITPRDVHALPNAAAVEQAYARVMAELPAQRYARTEFSQLEERRLGDDLTMLTGSGTWVDTSGKKFMPFGMTYVLRRASQHWRIVTAIIHGTDAK